MDNLSDPTGQPGARDRPGRDRPDLPGAALLRIEALLADGAKLLRCADTPRLQAELLLASVPGRPRSYLMAHAGDCVDASGARRYHELLARAVAGEPIAYLL